MGNYLFFISKELRLELSLQRAGLACTGPLQWKAVTEDQKPKVILGYVYSPEKLHLTFFCWYWSFIYENQGLHLLMCAQCHVPGPHMYLLN